MSVVWGLRGLVGGGASEDLAVDSEMDGGGGTSVLVSGWLDSRGSGRAARGACVGFGHKPAV